MEIQTENGLKEVFSYLEAGNPDKARRIIEHLLETDLTGNEVVFTSNCCNLWSNTTFRILEIEDPFERGENLLSEWKSFKSYVNRQKYVYEPTVYAIQKGVFTSALQNYMQVIDEKDTTHKSEIYRKIGLCYKKLGSFENARQCLAEANKLLPNQAPVLADLADCYALCGEDKGAKVYVSKKDEAFLTDNSLNLANTLGYKVKEFTADYTVSEGDILSVCGIEFKVIETPGHTEGSVCYVVEDKIFAGDTLFERSFGRYDFPTGNVKKLIKSIDRLFNLDGDYTVYSGHGNETTLKEERLYNAILNYM